jgi:protein tyrosine/serine phosphatase
MIMKKKQPIIYIPDEEFTNFMEVRAGNIAAGVLYRSSRPLKGSDIKKAEEALAVKAGIQCVINLEDENSVLEYVSKETPWYYKLVSEEKVIGLSMTFNIPGGEMNEKKLKAALRFMIAHEGPYLIHCFAGVDRTGFVAALLEALMGASLKEICRDYLAAFGPDYSDSFRLEYYRKMKNLLNQKKKMVHGKIITRINIQAAAEQYLLDELRLSQEEITKLKNILGKKSRDNPCCL